MLKAFSSEKEITTLIYGGAYWLFKHLPQNQTQPVRTRTGQKQINLKFFVNICFMLHGNC